MRHGCGEFRFSVTAAVTTSGFTAAERSKKDDMQKYVINQHRDNPDLWKILSINNPDGIARTDGRYPARVGCIVVILAIGVNKQLAWSYVADADGNKKHECRESGRLNTVSYDPITEILYAESNYSHYRLKKMPEKWGDIYADRSIRVCSH